MAVPGLSLWRGGAVKYFLRLNGVWGLWTVVLRQRFGQSAAYFAVFGQGYLKRKEARDEGLIYVQRSTIHLNPSNTGLEFS